MVFAAVNLSNRDNLLLKLISGLDNYVQTDDEMTSVNDGVVGRTVNCIDQYCGSKRSWEQSKKLLMQKESHGQLHATAPWRQFAVSGVDLLCFAQTAWTGMKSRRRKYCRVYSASTGGKRCDCSGNKHSLARLAVKALGNPILCMQRFSRRTDYCGTL